MNKKVKIAFIAACAIIVAALIFGIAYAIWEQSGTIKTKYKDISSVIDGEGLAHAEETEFSNYYMCDATGMSSDGIPIFLKFEGKDYGFDMGTTATALGSYSVSGNAIDVTYKISGDDSGRTATQRILIDGAIAFFDYAICCGDTIPETGNFNAVVSKVGTDGTSYQYTFHDDGSYELLYGKRGRVNWNTVTGHYTRNDDGTISRTLIDVNTGNENKTLDLYVYEGHLIDNFYVAITDAEFAEKIDYLESLGL